MQRDPTNAARWYELGVKQQENEREQKAVQALRRALELDPTHLAAWLALAISHTNEGNRSGAYSAIREWVERNERYSAAVAHFRALNPEPEDARSSERLQNMMQCLMSIVREHAGGEIDADIQIALAVLLNTNEVRRTPNACCFGVVRFPWPKLTAFEPCQDYAKARDCFTTALAVRPDVSSAFLRLYLETHRLLLARNRIGYSTIESVPPWPTAGILRRLSSTTTLPSSSTLATSEQGTPSASVLSSGSADLNFRRFNLGISCTNLRVSPLPGNFCSVVGVTNADHVRPLK